MSSVTETPVNQAFRYESYVETQLGKARARIRLLDLAVAGLLLVGGTLLYAVSMAMVDRLFDLPPLIRQLAFGTYVVVALICVALVLSRILFRRVNPYYAALQVEHGLSDVKNSVVNWLDLRERELPPAIKNAVSQRAAKDLARADLDQLLSTRWTRWIGAATGGLLLALIVLFFLSPPQFLSLLKRSFAPFTEGAIATRTQLTLLQPENGDLTVAVGRAVTFAVGVDGKVPEAGQPQSLRLRYRYQPTDPFVERPLAATDSSRHWGTLLPASEVRNGFWYTIAGGDAETQEYRVLVRSTPLVTDSKVTYSFRAYLNRPDYTNHEPNLEGLRGTKATIVARTNRVVRDGQLEFTPRAGEDGKTRPASIEPGERVSDDPMALRFRLVLLQSGVYRIWFTSAEGEKNTDPVPHTVRVVNDEAPRVALTKPGQPVSLPANGTLALEGMARDDFGLTRMALRMEVDGQEQSKPYRPGKSFKFENGNFPLKLVYKDLLDLEKLKQPNGHALQPGMTVEYWVEAADNCDYMEPNVGKSERFKITILPPENNPEKQQEQQQQRQREKNEQQKHEQNQDQQLQEDQQKQENQQNQGDKNDNQQSSDQSGSNEQNEGDKNLENQKQKIEDAIQEQEKQEQGEKKNEQGKGDSSQDQKDDQNSKGDGQKGDAAKDQKETKDSKGDGQKGDAAKDQKESKDSKGDGQKGDAAKDQKETKDSKGDGQKGDAAKDQKETKDPKGDGQKGDAAKDQKESKDSKGDGQKGDAAKDQKESKDSKGDGQKGDAAKDQKETKDPKGDGQKGDAAKDQKESKDSKGDGQKGDAAKDQKESKDSKGDGQKGDAAKDQKETKDPKGDGQKGDAAKDQKETKDPKGDGQKGDAAKDQKESKDSKGDGQKGDAAKDQKESKDSKGDGQKGDAAKDQKETKDSKGDGQKGDAAKDEKERKDSKGDGQKGGAAKDEKESKDSKGDGQKGGAAKDEKESKDSKGEASKAHPGDSDPGKTEKSDGEKREDVEKSQSSGGGKEPPGARDRPPVDNPDPAKGTEADPKHQKKAGDLQLEDIRKKVDKEVLKKANMTESEFQEFLKAYEAMLKRKQPGNGVEEKLTDPKTGGGKLKNIGPRQMNATGKDDKTLKGGIALPPPEFRDAFKEFSEKIAEQNRDREKK